MNLEISSAAVSTYDLLAKTNKNVGANKEKTLPWFVIFEIKNEVIDVAQQYPAPDAQRLEVKDYVEDVWNPLVDILTKQYAKNGVYVVVDFAYTNTEGNDISVPVFFKWCPDTVGVRSKMLIGSSFQAAKKRFDANNVTPELSQADQLQINNFASLAKIKGWVNK